MRRKSWSAVATTGRHRFSAHRLRTRKRRGLSVPAALQIAADSHPAISSASSTGRLSSEPKRSSLRWHTVEKWLRREFPTCSILGQESPRIAFNEATGSPTSPQGTMVWKPERSGLTLKLIPWNDTHFFKRKPIAAIFPASVHAPDLPSFRNPSTPKSARVWMAISSRLWS